MTNAEQLARLLSGKKLAIRNGKEGPTPEFILPIAYAVTSPDSEEEVLVVLQHPLPYCSSFFTGKLAESINQDVFIHAITVKGEGDPDLGLELIAIPDQHQGLGRDPIHFRVEIVR